MSVTELFSFFFVYTPFPWVAILCIILYRHDLSQVFHPFKERCSIKDIKSVLQNLEIPLVNSSNFGSLVVKRRAVFCVGRLRTNISERFPSTGLYAVVLVIVASSSLLSTFIVEPVLFGRTASFFLNSRFDGIVLVGFQIVSALPTTIAMQQYFGPFPSTPNKYHLRKRRLGSLVRYQENLSKSSSQ